MWISKMQSDQAVYFPSDWVRPLSIFSRHARVEFQGLLPFFGNRIHLLVGFMVSRWHLIDPRASIWLTPRSRRPQ